MQRPFRQKLKRGTGDEFSDYSFESLGWPSGRTRLNWPNFSNNTIASRLDPAQPLAITWNGAGAWLIFSQSRQENFSRTYWITFQDFGMTPSVSVMSSPSRDSRDPPQQLQATGPGTITRSRGRWSGNGWRDGRLSVDGDTVVVVFLVLAAAISAASSSSVAAVSRSSSVNSS